MTTFIRRFHGVADHAKHFPCMHNLIYSSEQLESLYTVSISFNRWKVGARAQRLNNLVWVTQQVERTGVEPGGQPVS